MIVIWFAVYVGWFAIPHFFAFFVTDKFNPICTNIKRNLNVCAFTLVCFGIYCIPGFGLCFP